MWVRPRQLHSGTMQGPVPFKHGNDCATASRLATATYQLRIHAYRSPSIPRLLYLVLSCSSSHACIPITHTYTQVLLHSVVVAADLLRPGPRNGPQPGAGLSACACVCVRACA